MMHKMVISAYYIQIWATVRIIVTLTFQNYLVVNKKKESLQDTLKTLLHDLKTRNTLELEDSLESLSLKNIV